MGTRIHPILWGCGAEASGHAGREWYGRDGGNPVQETWWRNWMRTSSHRVMMKVGDGKGGRIGQGEGIPSTRTGAESDKV